MAISFVVNKEEFTNSAADLGGSFDPIPNGDYEAELIDVKLGKFANSGANAALQALLFTWKLTDSNEVGVNRRLWSRVALADKFASGSDNFSVKQFANAIGIQPDDDGQLEFPDLEDMLDEGYVIGLEVSVSDREYKGAKTNEIGRYLSPEQLAKRLAKPKAGGDKSAGKGGTVKDNGLFV